MEAGVAGERDVFVEQVLKGFTSLIRLLNKARIIPVLLKVLDEVAAGVLSLERLVIGLNKAVGVIPTLLIDKESVLDGGLDSLRWKLLAVDIVVQDGLSQRVRVVFHCESRPADVKVIDNHWA